MNPNDTLSSYRESFESPLGAYVYMMFNQNKPEFFTVSSNEISDISNKLESILLKAKDVDSIFSSIQEIPGELFEKVQNKNGENDLSKSALLKLVGNLKYNPVDWKSENAWDELKGFVEYNNYSPFIKDKEPLQKQLKEYAEKFSLASFSLNPNFNPLDFIDKLDKGINSMCEVLNISPKQIGLNILNLNYKNEEGDFTGYCSNQEVNGIDNHSFLNKMVINKPEVLAHEWIHFIDNALGVKEYSFTELMDTNLSQKVKDILRDYSQVLEFKDVLNKKENSYSEVSLYESLKSASHFFERYAIDRENFHSNIKKIGLKFESDYKEGKVKETCLESVEYSVKELLKDPYPNRYFSFLKAQCEIYVDKLSGESLKNNQFLDFAKISDKHLKLGDYTESTMETFARSFEAFLFDKAKSMNKDCCLVAKSYDSDMYPQSKMRESLNDKWGMMWEQIKKGIDKAMPVESSKVLDKSFIINNIDSFRSKFNQNNSNEVKPRLV